MKKSAIEKLCAFSVVMIFIIFKLYSFLFVYLDTLDQTVSIYNKLAQSVIEMAFLFMVVWIYFSTVFSNPGYIESEEVALLDDEEEINEIKKRSSKFKQDLNAVKKYMNVGGSFIKEGEYNKELAERCKRLPIKLLRSEASKIYLEYANTRLYCFKCNLIKEPRTHHCSKCKKCVKRFDHHCVWIGNCVGLNNIKYFVQLLLYASAGLLYESSIIIFYYMFNRKAVD